MIGITLVLGLLIIPALLQELPNTRIREARTHLSQAETLEALALAPVEYHKALFYYDSAMLSWKNENKKMFFRDYSISQYYADRANFWAENAITFAQQQRAQRSASLENRINLLRHKLDAFDRIYGSMPMSQEELNLRATLRIDFQEIVSSEASHEKAIKLTNLEKSITQLNQKFDTRLRHYFEQFPAWKQQVEQAVTLSSKNKATLIIVDKYGRTCHLYQSGRLIDSFPAELGPNWMGDKLYSGDQSTPEGLYKVTMKKEGGLTKYYKALLINYPNVDDRKRYEEAMRNGLLTKKYSIGGLIEIHGHGGKGANWTNGCVAVRNEDMDKLYARCINETPVLIVGSMKSLNEILQ